MIKKIYLTLFILISILMLMSAISAADLNAQGSFTDLNTVLDSSNVSLNQDYIYNINLDNDFKEGIEINHDIVINGNGHKIDGNNAARIFSITNCKVTLNNLTLTHGSSEKGGALYSYNSTIIIDNCNVSHNDAKGIYSEGGAIYTENGELKIFDSTFSNNKADAGGSIHALKTDVMFKSSQFCNNSAEYYGGVILTDYNLYIDSSEFTYNSAGYRGGVIDGTWHNNNNSYIHAYIQLNNSLISYNFAKNGGVLSLSSCYGTNIITNCIISNNNAYYGAILSKTSKTNIKITESELCNNTAVQGAICYGLSDGNIILNQDYIHNNAAEEGTIIYNPQGNTFILNSLSEDNEQNNSLIWIGEGDLTITNSSLNASNQCIINKTEEGNIYLFNDYFGLNPDFSKLINSPKSKIIFKENYNFDSEEEYEFEIGKECCSVVVQLKDNYGTITHRRDGGYPFNLYITSDDVIRQQKTSISYFFLTFLTKDGWLVGKGGGDSSYTNEKVEAIALKMISTNNISSEYINLISKETSVTRLGHFIIKSPNGTFAAISYKDDKNITEYGVLNEGDYIICPNGPDYFVKGHIDEITDPVYISRYLTATDAYGSNRHNDMTYYYQGNLIDIYASNDDGSLCNKNDGLADSIWIQNTYIPGKNIPNIINGLHIASIKLNENSSWSYLNDKIQNAKDNDIIFLNGLNYTAEKIDGTITINKNMTIIGGFNENDKTRAIIDSNKILNCNFKIAENATVIFKNIDFKNFNDKGKTGSIENNGFLTLDSCSVENSTASTSIIYNLGNLTILNSLFNENKAYRYGLIYNEGNILIDSSKFDSNSANTYEYGGSVVYSYLGTTKIINSIFNKNDAEYGGVFNTYSGNMIVICSKFNNNTASNYGGVFYNSFASITIIKCDFNDNYGRLGGAIYNEGDCNITDSNFSLNRGYSEGSCVFNEGKLEVSNCNFVNNQIIDENKGATIINLKNSASIYNSTFTNNISSNGICIKNQEGKLKITTCLFNTSSKLKNKYIYSTEDIEVDKSKFITDICLSADIITTADNMTISISDGCDYPNKENKLTYLNINNETFVLNRDEVSLSNLKVGMYKIGIDKIISNNTNKYENNNFAYFIVLDYTLEVDDLIMYYKDGSNIKAILKENNLPLSNETIAITVNNNTYYKLTDEDGIAKLNINLNPGKYDVTVAYGLLSVKSTVIVLSTIEGSDIVKYFHNETAYSARFLDENGEPLTNTEVKFNINGVFYRKTTDENGIAKLNINLNPGEYVLTAINPVNGEMHSNLVKILPIIIGSNLETIYQEDAQYSCKIVDGQGTPIKGAEVTLNIHGVFYHKITDDEGIARLNIRLLPGEYIITAIYNGTMTSNTITVRDL